jgi:hypothetical protein
MKFSDYANIMNNDIVQAGVFRGRKVSANFADSVHYLLLISKSIHENKRY